jgi:hypothetical protein
MSDVIMRQNDLRPYLDAQLRDVNGPRDLTGEVVRFVMRSSDNTVETDQTSTGAQLSITASTNGEVRYKWLPEDTDTAGNFLAEFETWPSGSSSEPATFPNRGHVEILFTPELST